MNFDRLQDLIDYCALCPVCQSERELSISVGPDSNLSMGFGNDDDTDLTKLKSFLCENNELILKVEVRISQFVYRITFTINTLTNELTSSIPDAHSLKPGEQATDRATHPAMYFYLYARCEECGSGINTENIELDILHKTITNIWVEQETRMVKGQDGIFDLTYTYSIYGVPHTATGNITIMFLPYSNDPDSSWHAIPNYGSKPLFVDWEINKGFVIPIDTEFDFSDRDKLFERLKTLMFFS